MPSCKIILVLVRGLIVSRAKQFLELLALRLRSLLYSPTDVEEMNYRPRMKIHHYVAERIPIQKVE